MLEERISENVDAAANSNDLLDLRLGCGGQLRSFSEPLGTIPRWVVSQRNRRGSWIPNSLLFTDRSVL